MADSWEEYAEDVEIGAGNDQEQEDPMLDSWEDALKDSDEEDTPVVAKIKKKTINEAIHERKLAEAEKKRLAVAQRVTEMSPEEIKKQREEAVLKADLENTIDLFGAAAVVKKPVVEADTTIILDCKTAPQTKAALDEYSALVAKKINSFKLSSKLLFPFIEHLSKELCDQLDYSDIRRVSSTLSALSNDKQRLEKENAKKGKKVNKKAQVKVAADDFDLDPGAGAAALGAEFDDFM